MPHPFPHLQQQQQQLHGPSPYDHNKYGHDPQQNNPLAPMTAIQPLQSQNSPPPPPLTKYKQGAAYRDFSIHPDPVPDSRRNRGGVVIPFPEKLHQMLDYAEKEGLSHIVSFFPHGRAFAIHKPSQFVSDIMPKFFKQSRFTSFQRQVNLYGFHRISHGPDSGGYYHELFLKGRPGLSMNMKRTKIKGVTKGRSDPEKEPDFYRMPPVLPSNSVPRNVSSLMNEQNINNIKQDTQQSSSSEMGLPMLLPNQDKQGVTRPNVSLGSSLKPNQLGDSSTPTRNDTMNPSYLSHAEMMNFKNSFIDPNYGSLSLAANPNSFYPNNMGPNMGPNMWPSQQQQSQLQMPNLPPHNIHNAALNAMPTSGLTQPSMNMNNFNLPQNTKEVNQATGKQTPQMNPFLGSNEEMQRLPLAGKEGMTKTEEFQNMPPNTSNQFFGGSSSNSPAMMPPPMNDYGMQYYSQIKQNLPQSAAAGMSSNMPNPSIRPPILPQHLSNPYSRMPSSPQLNILRQMNPMSGQPPMHIGSENVGLQLSQQQQHLQNLSHFGSSFDMTPAGPNSNQFLNSDLLQASSFGHEIPMMSSSNNSAMSNPYLLNQPSAQYNIPKHIMSNQSQTQSEQQQPGDNLQQQNMFQQQVSTSMPTNKYETYKHSITRNDTNTNAYKTSFETSTSNENIKYSEKVKHEDNVEKV